MKSLFIIILSLSIVGITANASHSAQYWAKTYGGSGGEGANSVRRTLMVDLLWLGQHLRLELGYLISGC
jgi:hypothetical protein